MVKGRQVTLEALPAGSYFVQVRAGAYSGGKALVVK